MKQPYVREWRRLMKNEGWTYFFSEAWDPHTELDNLISTELDNCLISTELDSEISTQLDNCQISTQLDKINFT